ncbi:MAG: ABC transporter substrate-binding protein [Acutalibacteraceae bacterium]|jgi:ABC-type nitrate/sulfonate/bicarbonate transport system substrate-binding protein
MKRSVLRLACLALGALILLSGMSGCSDTPGTLTDTDESVAIRLAIPEDALGLAALNLWARRDAGSAFHQYTIQKVASSEAAGELLKAGKVDAAIMTPVDAVSLFTATDGNVQAAAITALTGGQLLENGNAVRSPEDLGGKTVRYAKDGVSYPLIAMLEKAGVSDEVTLRAVDAADLTAAADEPGAILYADEPTATLLRMGRPAMRVALVAADALGDEAPAAGCLAVGKAFAATHPTGMRRFLEELEASLERANALPDETAALCKQYGVFATDDVASAAIINCRLTYLDGDKMAGRLSDDFKRMDTTRPGDDFYFIER